MAEVNSQDMEKSTIIFGHNDNYSVCPYRKDDIYKQASPGSEEPGDG